MINCPFCGKLTDPKLSNCPHCGVPLRAPAARARQAPPAAVAPPNTRPCPNCSAPVHEGDIICVRCGTNLLTGQKLTGGSTAPPPARRREFASLIPWIAGAVALLIIAAGVVALLLLILRDPVEEARRQARGGNVLEALNTLQAHVDETPDNVEAQMLLGELYWQTQQYANAARAFEAASRLDPQNEQAGFHAVAAAGRAGGEEGRNQQIAALRRIVDNHPDNGRARYLLGLALGADGNFEQQAEQLARVDTAEAAGARQYLALAQALAGNLEAAHAELRAAATTAAGPDAAAALGFVASLHGDQQQAEQALQQAVAADTAIAPFARARLGLIYLSEGEIDLALPLLREAVNAGNPPPSVRFFYALALQEMGLETEAFTEYEQLISTRSSFAAEAAVQTAIIYMNQGNLDRAAEVLRSATRDGADANPKLYTLQGQLHARQGNYVEAQQSFRLAMQAQPNYAPAHLENGLVLVARGMMDEGVTELRTYLALIEEQGGAAPEIELLVEQLGRAVGGGDALPAPAIAAGAPTITVIDPATGEATTSAAQLPGDEVAVTIVNQEEENPAP